MPISYKALHEADRRHHIHAKTNPTEYARHGGMMITRAAGAKVWDDRGVAYVDAVAGLANVNIGYGHPRMIEALGRQMRELSYFHTFTGFTNPAVAALGEKLASIMPPDLSHFYYVSSGSEAIDTAVKFAHFYWRQQGRADKRLIIGLDRAYHGNTIVASALTGMPEYHDQFDLPLDSVRHIITPEHVRDAADPAGQARLAASRLRAIIELEGADNIAAFIGEPILASGGAVMPADGYWQEIRKICDEYDILLILDEVITGFGRLGYWLGSSHWGITGDIIAMAKGISSAYVPMGAVALRDHVAEVVLASDDYFMHGFSATGHPLACMATIANIEIIESEGMLEAVRDGSGRLFREGLQRLRVHPVVTDVRAIGLAAGIDLDFSQLGVTDPVLRDYPAAALSMICRRLGLIIRGNERTVLLSPPLCISDADVSFILAMLDTGLRAMIGEVRRKQG